MRQVRVFFSDGTTQDIGGRYTVIDHQKPKSYSAHRGVFVGMTYDVQDEWLIIYEEYQVQWYHVPDYNDDYDTLDEGWFDCAGERTRREVARYRPTDWSRVQLV